MLSFKADAAELGIAAALFSSIAEEMGVTLGRSAHSPNIKERETTHAPSSTRRAGSWRRQLTFRSTSAQCPPLSRRPCRSPRSRRAISLS